MTGGVVAEGLSKRFDDFDALIGVDFAVPEGALVALLGPNGAGKTTTIRILTTLLRADAGHATVAGYDVATQPQLVRGAIGVTGQYAAVDEDLSGRENLVLVGRLCRMKKKAAQERAAALLEVFELTDAADRRLRTYSGGMRRRLDLGGSLMFAPEVLFLDEPTTGLDPRSRLDLWDVIVDLKEAGTTIVLTTQYLEEADQLADTISVIDNGRIIEEGTADQLKDRIGGDVIDLRVHDRSQLDEAAASLMREFEVAEADVAVNRDLGSVVVPVGGDGGGSASLVTAIRTLDAAGIRIDDLSLRRPSLDDVFLHLTGHAAETRVGAKKRRGRMPASGVR
ncbi:MAG: ATP-binding cassette domain-containing protein [Acidimicrobiia bacterium]|nr:ATP-binding cassette domain-containing protein [Acidimicrobiia bacterium]